jgi:acetate kinase
VAVVLTLNAGSASLKYALYELGEEERQLAEGGLGRVGQGGLPDHDAAFTTAMAELSEADLPEPEAVGHRLVHGGAKHAAPERVDRELLQTLRDLAPFAPLHLPPQIMGIEAVADRYPDLPQVACFDTAFHRRMPELAQRFPLPEELWESGVRRYGFHGLSYEFVVWSLRAQDPGRLLIAHLGNGSSMAAVSDGAPVDTTMGFTPAAGLMMGTRSGDLDPGLATYLIRERGFDGEALDRLVNQEAGLLSVSGGTSDMKTLIETRETNPRAALAVDMYCYLASKQAGAMVAALGGLDTLVFTGGIGERAAPVRAQICAGLGHLGVELDPESNDRAEEVVSSEGSRCTVRVVHTDEDLMIARHVRELLFAFAG